MNEHDRHRLLHDKHGAAFTEATVVTLVSKYGGSEAAGKNIFNTASSALERSKSNLDQLVSVHGDRADGLVVLVVTGKDEAGDVYEWGDVIAKNPILTGA